MGCSQQVLPIESLYLPMIIFAFLLSFPFKQSAILWNNYYSPDVNKNLIPIFDKAQLTELEYLNIIFHLFQNKLVNI